MSHSNPDDDYFLYQMKQEEAEDLQKKIMSAKFDFNDFLKQTRAVAQMGSMSRVIGMIPGMGKVIFLSSLFLPSF